VPIWNIPSEYSQARGFLLTYSLNHATNHTQNRCTTLKKSRDVKMSVD
jgi:hypothetical protein